MTLRRFLLSVSLLLVPGLPAADGLDPAKLLQPPTDTWPTYNGDYSGRRFSPLKKINASSVKAMTLAWVYRSNLAPAAESVRRSRRRRSKSMAFSTSRCPTTPGQSTRGPAANCGTSSGKPKAVFISATAVLASTAIGFISRRQTPIWFRLNIKDGTERWHEQIADVKQEYFSTPAPIVIGNHIIVGIGGDSLDVPGYLQSHDPETGALQWRWYTTPRKGEPGAETWPNEEAMIHGGGMTWVPGTYDPGLNLL